MNREEAEAIVVKLSKRAEALAGNAFYPTVARKESLVDYAHRVRVRFNARLWRCSGRATYHRALIELNPAYWDWADRLERYKLIEHEAAHLITDYYFGWTKQGHHGRTWQLMMTLLRSCDDV